jgi:hypothetical protein
MLALMVMVSPRLSAPFDLLVFDAEDVPVLAVEVKSQARPGDDTERLLRTHATEMGIPYGLVVDREMIRLIDIAAPAAPPLLELPTRELLTAYAHGLDANKVSGRYLVLLVDSWLRNVMQPLAADHPPAFDRLTDLGLSTRLHEGQAVAEWRGFF